jgi:hypothetical protein
MAAMLLGTTSMAQSVAGVNEQLFRELKKHPNRVAEIGVHRVQVVNDRYEPCATRKEGQYLRMITPDRGGYRVLVWTPDGHLLMAGSALDAAATDLHGPFRYYDAAGVLRAEGSYDHGNKIGAWERYDAQGAALVSKEYDGLDWEGKQVKLGLATKSPTLTSEQAMLIAGE